MPGATQTLSLVDRDDDAAGFGPYLVVALEGARPLAGSNRYSLVGISEVRIGRGDRRAARRDGSVLELSLPDGSLSSLHSRLVRDRGGWLVEDAGSKNGTFVDGVRAARTPLTDDAVIDLARTMLLVVDPGGTADPGDLELAGDSDPLATLDPVVAARLDTTARAARAEVPILLLGETGTGKEVIARAIHAWSARPGPYVAVNCAALPATLLESELFGVRRGAYSGALEDRPGLIRAADHGTLFLDEIAELAPASQAALLRVLQEHEVVPVGGHAPIAVDLRIAAATCQALPALVELDRFRRDLYARLAGFTLTLPPLRARRADLGVLIARLLARHAGDRAPGIARGAARALFAHRWPGNIRELDQALAAAIAVADGELGLQHLPETVRAPAPAPPPPPEVDRDRLDELLRSHRGNVSRVAEALHTSRSQVRRLIDRFGLTLDDYRT